MANTAIPRSSTNTTNNRFIFLLQLANVVALFARVWFSSNRLTGPRNSCEFGTLLQPITARGREEQSKREQQEGGKIQSFEKILRPTAP